MSKGNLKIIDLFSGAGGLSEGFQLAGFNVILGIDNFEPALKTFQLNHPNSEVQNINLAKTIPEPIKKWLKKENIIGIIGGPPCQGFSDAKGSRSISDSRNDLVFSFLNWVKTFQPTFFVMENVTGITTIQKGQFFTHVKQEFQKMGYLISAKVLHAAEHGVPQKRERMFLIGVNNEYDISTQHLHPPPQYYIPYEMRGISGKQHKKTFNGTLDHWIENNTNYQLNLKHFTTIRDAFEGLPENTTSEGIVELPDSIHSEYMYFIRKKGKIKKTTLHVAKPVKEKDLKIVEKIPEGKIYRSNRFGKRYISVWEVFSDEFSQEELEILKFLGHSQTKKNLIIESNKEEGHVDFEIIKQSLTVNLKILDQLVEKKWVSKKQLNGKIGYRLSTRAGLRPRFMRLNRDSISHTILTVDFDGREKIHPTQNRGISLREGARIQSFPDDFHFEGNFNEVAKQIGNAVPPLLAYQIARNLSNQLRLHNTPEILFPLDPKSKLEELVSYE